MQLKISHQTSYHYDAPVEYALQQLRLIPKDRKSQSVLEWELAIEGGTEELSYVDHNNNQVVLIRLNSGCQNLSVTAQGIIETNDSSGIIGFHGGYAPLWYFLRSTPLTASGVNVRKLIAGFSEMGEDDVTRLHALSAKILDQVAYKPGATTVDFSAEDVLKNEAGVCQDHTHVMIAAARRLGFPARYVSGYLMLTDRVDQDASHAWAEVYVDNIGWIGFDVSNAISPDMRYVAVATGLDYSETAPISGMRLGEGNESMIVSLQVQQ